MAGPEYAIHGLTPGHVSSATAVDFLTRVPAEGGVEEEGEVVLGEEEGEEEVAETKGEDEVDEEEEVEEGETSKWGIFRRYWHSPEP